MIKTNLMDTMKVTMLIGALGTALLDDEQNYAHRYIEQNYPNLHINKTTLPMKRVTMKKQSRVKV